MKSLISQSLGQEFSLILSTILKSRYHCCTCNCSRVRSLHICHNWKSFDDAYFLMSQIPKLLGIALAKMCHNRIVQQHISYSHYVLLIQTVTIQPSERMGLQPQSIKLSLRSSWTIYSDMPIGMSGRNTHKCHSQILGGNLFCFFCCCNFNEHTASSYVGHAIHQRRLLYTPCRYLPVTE